MVHWPRPRARMSSRLVCGEWKDSIMDFRKGRRVVILLFCCSLARTLEVVEDAGNKPAGKDSRTCCRVR